MAKKPISPAILAGGRNPALSKPKKAADTTEIAAIVAAAVAKVLDK